jgi:EAL domain-containing protein (putative c-di-GMP-specific phosphodiesterase class I)
VIKRRIESILFVPLFINETELPLQYHLSVNAVRLPIDKPKQWLIRHEPSKVLIHSNSCEKTAYLRYGDPSELAHYQALTQAFYEGELKLAFQPIIDLMTGRAFGFTSHLVWEEHPQINNAAVLQLLSLGTNERLINDLTDWVIRLSQSALYELKTKHSDVQSMFIPFSLAQTYSNDMPSLFRNLRSETDHSLSDIILQLPVEMTLDNSTKLIEIAHELISSGVDLAMGPLGGALHVHQLSQIPVSYLSVDTVPFKHELAHDDERPSMLTALLAINNALCTTSIAYNISSLEQAHALAHLGFRFGQGDALAVPMYLSSLKSWLSHHPYLTF